MTKEEAELAGAKLAAQFAQELGLKPGNMWEPAIARGIAQDLMWDPLPVVERSWRTSVGLRKKDVDSATELW